MTDFVLTSGSFKVANHACQLYRAVRSTVTMYPYLSLLLFASSAVRETRTEATKDEFQCNGSKVLPLYQSIYSLSVIVDNQTVVTVEHGPMIINNSSRVTAVDVVANLTSLWLRATLDSDCRTLATAKCEVFGMIDRTSFNLEFAPSHNFTVTPDSFIDPSIHVLSSSLIVYLSIAVVPIACRITKCIFPKIPNIERGQLRIIRTTWSIALVIVLSMWLLIGYYTHSAMFFNTGVWLYFVLEVVFLVGYFFLRCISHRRLTGASASTATDPRATASSSAKSTAEAGSSHQQLLHNTTAAEPSNDCGGKWSTICSMLSEECLGSWRGALSCFAVITPIVSWVFLKYHLQLHTSEFEYVWWAVSAVSVLWFMCVFNKNEFMAWKEKTP